MSTDRFRYSVFWSDEDEQYVATCAAYPLLSHLADSAQDALEGIGRLARAAQDVADSQEEEQEEDESADTFTQDQLQVVATVAHEAFLQGVRVSIDIISKGAGADSTELRILKHAYDRLREMC